MIQPLCKASLRPKAIRPESHIQDILGSEAGENRGTDRKSEAQSSYQSYTKNAKTPFVSFKENRTKTEAASIMRSEPKENQSRNSMKSETQSSFGKALATEPTVAKFNNTNRNHSEAANIMSSETPGNRGSGIISETRKCFSAFDPKSTPPRNIKSQTQADHVQLLMQSEHQENREGDMKTETKKAFGSGYHTQPVRAAAKPAPSMLGDVLLSEPAGNRSKEFRSEAQGSYQSYLPKSLLPPKTAVERKSPKSLNDFYKTIRADVPSKHQEAAIYPSETLKETGKTESQSSYQAFTSSHGEDSGRHPSRRNSEVGSIMRSEPQENDDNRGMQTIAQMSFAQPPSDAKRAVPVPPPESETEEIMKSESKTPYSMQTTAQGSYKYVLGERPTPAKEPTSEVGDILHRFSAIPNTTSRLAFQRDSSVDVAPVKPIIPTSGEIEPVFRRESTVSSGQEQSFMTESQRAYQSLIPKELLEQTPVTVDQPISEVPENTTSGNTPFFSNIYFSHPTNAEMPNEQATNIPPSKKPKGVKFKSTAQQSYRAYLPEEMQEAMNIPKESQLVNRGEEYAKKVIPTISEQERLQSTSNLSYPVYTPHEVREAQIEHQNRDAFQMSTKPDKLNNQMQLESTAQSSYRKFLPEELQDAFTPLETVNEPQETIPERKNNKTPPPNSLSHQTYRKYLPSELKEASTSVNPEEAASKAFNSSEDWLRGENPQLSQTRHLESTAQSSYRKFLPEELQNAYALEHPLTQYIPIEESENDPPQEDSNHFQSTASMSYRKFLPEELKDSFMYPNQEAPSISVSDYTRKPDAVKNELKSTAHSAYRAYNPDELVEASYMPPTNTYTVSKKVAPLMKPETETSNDHFKSTSQTTYRKFAPEEMKEILEDALGYTGTYTDHSASDTKEPFDNLQSTQQYSYRQYLPKELQEASAEGRAPIGNVKQLIKDTEYKSEPTEHFQTTAQHTFREYRPEEMQAALYQDDLSEYEPNSKLLTTTLFPPKPSDRQQSDQFSTTQFAPHIPSSSKPILADVSSDAPMNSTARLSYRQYLPEELQDTALPKNKKSSSSFEKVQTPNTGVDDFTSTARQSYRKYLPEELQEDNLPVTSKPPISNQSFSTRHLIPEAPTESTAQSTYRRFRADELEKETPAAGMRKTVTIPTESKDIPEAENQFKTVAQTSYRHFLPQESAHAVPSVPPTDQTKTLGVLLADTPTLDDKEHFESTHQKSYRKYLPEEMQNKRIPISSKQLPQVPPSAKISDKELFQSTASKSYVQHPPNAYVLGTPQKYFGGEIDKANPESVNRLSHTANNLQALEPEKNDMESTSQLSYRRFLPEELQQSSARPFEPPSSQLPGTDEHQRDTGVSTSQVSYRKYLPSEMLASRLSEFDKHGANSNPLNPPTSARLASTMSNAQLSYRKYLPSEVAAVAVSHMGNPSAESGVLDNKGGQGNMQSTMQDSYRSFLPQEIKHSQPPKQPNTSTIVNEKLSKKPADPDLFKSTTHLSYRQYSKEERDLADPLFNFKEKGTKMRSFSNATAGTTKDSEFSYKKYLERVLDDTTTKTKALPLPPENKSMPSYKKYLPKPTHTTNGHSQQSSKTRSKTESVTKLSYKQYLPQDLKKYNNGMPPVDKDSSVPVFQNSN
eukprot:m.147631 g.147631  ORF g.147631 m.147631 type:complete len:1636 (-) comp14988_c0_seq26:208-5115(-)